MSEGRQSSDTSYLGKVLASKSLSDARSYTYLGMAQAQAKHKAESKENDNWVYRPGWAGTKQARAKKNGHSRILAAANAVNMKKSSRMGGARCLARRVYTRHRFPGRSRMIAAPMR